MPDQKPGKAVYTIYSSPHHPAVPDHLPSLIVTPSGRPSHILYTFLHTNFNQENYILTPAEAGDLCVAKLFPPLPESQSSGSSRGHGRETKQPVRCEASRGLRWSIHNTGVAMPTYRVTLPSSDPNEDEDQPLFQISKTSRNAPYWTLTYYTYAGHQVPPNRVPFGRIEKLYTDQGRPAGTRIIVTGQTEEERAVWQTLGEGNEDMVEWIIVGTALNVLDDEMREAARAAGMPLRAPPSDNSHAASPAMLEPPRERERTRSADPRAQAQERRRERELEHGMNGLAIRPSSSRSEQQSRPAPSRQYSSERQPPPIQTQLPPPDSRDRERQRSAPASSAPALPLPVDRMPPSRRSHDEQRAPIQYAQQPVYPTIVSRESGRDRQQRELPPPPLAQNIPAPPQGHSIPAPFPPDRVTPRRERVAPTNDYVPGSAYRRR